jgi:hypothetical protein
MPEKPSLKSWRRWLWISVRGSIVLVLILGGWIGCVVRSARSQHEAVAVVHRAGGVVSFDWPYDQYYGPDNVPLPAWLEWCVDRVGKDYFTHAVSVRLGIGWYEYQQPMPEFEKRSYDAGFAGIGQLSQLEILEVDGTRTEDRELANLQRLTCLKTLTLKDVRPTDNGLFFLRRLTQLEELDLAGTTVTDAGLAHLEGLARLRRLRLDGTSVTDAGLVHLKGLTGLRGLDLIETNVTDAGVQDLRRALPLLDISR